MSEQQPQDETTDSQAEAETKDSQLEESEPGDIGDDQLPEDLQPTEDNPLARHPGQTGDEDDKIGADTEGSDAENPSANMAYGSEDSNAPSEDTGDQTDDSDDSGSED